MDMAFVVEILSWAFILSGAFFGVTGALGLFRFPDFYTRLHAASITDTLCTGLIMAGLMLQAGLSLLVLKLGIILVILAYTSPTVGHAMAKSARKSGLEPVTGKPKGGRS